MTWNNRLFRDRKDAGQRLVAALPPLDPADTVVLALPRGGVPVAAEICKALGAPMDLVFVRKIGAPRNPELAVGAITNGDAAHVTVNTHVAHLLGLSDAQVRSMGNALLPEIERRRDLYLAGHAPLDLTGKTALVVDDGAATGTTLLASLKALKHRKPRRLLVALPVAPHGLIDRLHGLADDIICLRDLGSLGGVGGAYASFAQVNDSTVRDTLDRFGADQTQNE